MALKRHLWYTNLILINLEGSYLLFLCSFRPPGANFWTFFDDDEMRWDELHHLLTCVASPQVKMQLIVSVGLFSKNPSKCHCINCAIYKLFQHFVLQLWKVNIAFWYSGKLKDKVTLCAWFISLRHPFLCFFLFDNNKQTVPTSPPESWWAFQPIRSSVRSSPLNKIIDLVMRREGGQ